MSLTFDMQWLLSPPFSLSLSPFPPLFVDLPSANLDLLTIKQTKNRFLSSFWKEK